MQKRAAIARAMALDPNCFFSTSCPPDWTRLPRRPGPAGLESRAQPEDHLRVVTYELPSIFAIADRVIMLDKQEKGIIAMGSPQELRDHCGDPRVRQFFSREAPEEI
jgi:phospholipid/cholesterol/gamma-HCH transport system ATP-binding protein